MNKQSEFTKIIIISKVNKIGMVHLDGVKKYIEKHKAKKFYLITPTEPHNNVLKSAGQIKNLEIIVSPDFEKEKKGIKKIYRDEKLMLIDSYQIAGRDGMLDGA